MRKKMPRGKKPLRSIYEGAAPARLLKRPLSRQDKSRAVYLYSTITNKLAAIREKMDKLSKTEGKMNKVKSKLARMRGEEEVPTRTRRPDKRQIDELEELRRARQLNRQLLQKKREAPKSNSVIRRSKDGTYDFENEQVEERPRKQAKGQKPQKPIQPEKMNMLMKIAQQRKAQGNKVWTDLENEILDDGDRMPPDANSAGSRRSVMPPPEVLDAYPDPNSMSNNEEEETNEG
jgi:hypothetical protein